MSDFLLRPRFDRCAPIISHGHGATLYDTEGRDYIDGSSGAIVANIGHGVREVAVAAARQMSRAAEGEMGHH